MTKDNNSTLCNIVSREEVDEHLPTSSTVELLGMTASARVYNPSGLAKSIAQSFGCETERLDWQRYDIEVSKSNDPSLRGTYLVSVSQQDNSRRVRELVIGVSSQGVSAGIIPNNLNYKGDGLLMPKHQYDQVIQSLQSAMMLHMRNPHRVNEAWSYEVGPVPN